MAIARGRIDKSLTAELERSLQKIGVPAGREISTVVARQLQRQLGHLGGRIKYDLNVKIGSAMTRFSRQLALAQLQGFAGYARRFDTSVSRLLTRVWTDTSDAFKWGWHKLVEAVQDTTKEVAEVKVGIRHLSKRMTGRLGLFGTRGIFSTIMQQILGIAVQRGKRIYSGPGLFLQRLIFGALGLRWAGPMGGLAGLLGPPEYMRYIIGAMGLAKGRATLQAGAGGLTEGILDFANSIAKVNPDLAIFVTEMAKGPAAMTGFLEGMSPVLDTFDKFIKWNKDKPWYTVPAGVAAAGIAGKAASAVWSAKKKAWGPLLSKGALKVTLWGASAAATAYVGWSIGKALAGALDMKEKGFKAADWVIEKGSRFPTLRKIFGPSGVTMPRSLRSQYDEAVERMALLQYEIANVQARAVGIRAPGAKPLLAGQPQETIRLAEEERTKELRALRESLETTREELAKLTSEMRTRGVDIPVGVSGPATGGESLSDGVQKMAKDGIPP